MRRIRAAIGELEPFTADGEAASRGDVRTQRAVGRRFGILGEAAGRLPEPVRQHCPEVPWRVALDRRNRLIHGYATVDPIRVRHIRDLPRLRFHIEQVRAALRADENVQSFT